MPEKTTLNTVNVKSEDERPIYLVENRDIIFMVSAFGVLAITVVLMIFNLVYISRQAATAAQNHAAVCNYRSNLEAQVRSTNAYLAAHPDGAPSLGITAAQLRQTAARQQAAVDSLSGLNC